MQAASSESTASSARLVHLVRRAFIVVLAVVLPATIAVACRGSQADSPASSDEVDLPGVDTHELTPRERHEFSRYVTQLASPCPDVAVPLSQCILEKRACPACLPAAALVAKAVREGMAAEQVEGLYKERFDAASKKTIPIDGSPVRGPETAPVTIVEFADFACPFCQHMAPELDALVQRHEGSVRFVYKFMPLAMHPRGEASARAGIAALDQGKFWPMHHELFSHGDHQEDADFDAYAKALGLDLERFHADMQSPATTAKIANDRKLADDLGVKGTPTIYINGREYDAKVDIEGWVAAEIAAARGASPNK